MTAAATASQPAPTAPPQAHGIEHYCGQYIRLRAKIAEMEKAHSEVMKPYNEALEQLNGLLLQHLNTVGAESVRTGQGTVYVTKKKSATLADKKAFWDFVAATHNWDLVDYKANPTAVEDFLTEHKALPPGVNYTTTNVVGVRKK
jgi:hypothetical protein